MANLRSKTPYQKITRPAVGGKGLSGALSSQASKQQAAEDAIIDNQYSAGLISADAYNVELSKRLARPTLTPLQKVNLGQKIQDVQQKVADSEVDRKYAAGQLTTAQVRDYFKGQLSQITETNSAAYNQMAQKVQGLTDKAEKEARNDARIQENLRISTLPEDTSANLQAKAALYEKLQHQALIDGDANAAAQYETQKNNYLQAAQRASINDVIMNARNYVSGTPSAGLGVPSADGATLPNGTPISGGSTSAPSNVGANGPSGTGSPSVSGAGADYSGYSGANTPAIKNALTSLDRAQKSIERMNQDKADKTYMLSQYEQAIAMASGDQKTQLITAYNNLKDSVAQIDNSIAITTNSIYDTVDRIQTLQAAAAFSGFKMDVKKSNLEVAKAENDLEQQLRTGKISKADYILNSVNLTKNKADFMKWASDGYAQFGDDTTASKILDDIAYKVENTQAARILGQIQDPNNPGKVDENKFNQIVSNYELYRVDPGGNMDNISGASKGPGEITLRNFQAEKDAGVFDGSYVNDGGVYAKIRYKGETNPITGDLLPAQTVRQNLEKFGSGNAPFYYDANGQKKQIGIVDVPKADGTTETVFQPKDFIDKHKNLFVPQQVTGKTGLKENSPVLYQMIDRSHQNVVYDSKGNSRIVEEKHPTDGGSILRDPGYLRDVIAGKAPLFAKGSPGDTLINGAGNFIGSAQNTIQKFLNGLGKPNVQVNVPKIIPDAYAAERPVDNANQVPTTASGQPVRTWNDFVEVAKRVAAQEGFPLAVLLGQAALETGRQVGNAVGNNFFGIKGQGTAGSNVLGTKEQGANGLYNTQSAFAAFKTPEDAIKAYLNTIKARVPNLDQLKSDPVKLVQAIKNAGYATDNNYVAKVTGTPEFQQYKNMATQAAQAVTKAVAPKQVQAATMPSLPATPPMAGSSAQLRSTSASTPIAPLKIDDFGNALRSAAGAVTAPAQNILRSIENAGSSAGSAISSGISNVSHNISSGANSVGSYIQSIPMQIQKAATPVIQNIQKTATPVVQNIQKAVTSAPQNILKTVQNAASSVGNYLKNLFHF
jgi:hypothetical protein